MKVTASQRISGTFDGYEFSGAALAYSDNSISVRLEFIDCKDMAVLKRFASFVKSGLSKAIENAMNEKQNAHK